jgi:hypothetical protein
MMMEFECYEKEETLGIGVKKKENVVRKLKGMRPIPTRSRGRTEVTRARARESGGAKGSTPYTSKSPRTRTDTYILTGKLGGCYAQDKKKRYISSRKRSRLQDTNSSYSLLTRRVAISRGSAVRPVPVSLLSSALSSGFLKNQKTK